MKYALPLVITALMLTALPAGAKSYNKDYIGESASYQAEYEDTLVHLARDNDIGFVEMRAANPTLDPWIPGKGAKVTLPKQHLLPDAERKGIVINLPEMRIYYYEKPGEAPLSYAIGVGREGLDTPLGKTTVVRKRVGPTWTPTQRMRKEDPTLKAFYPAGPDNPMGTHALYLGWPTYAIHGTDKPFSVGRRASSGCIRLYPDQIKDFFPRVPVGTQVNVVDQPVKVGWIGDDMYVEVHPTQEQNLKVEDFGQLSSYEITKEDIRRIKKKAGEHQDKIDWRAVREAVKEHRGVPVKVLDVTVTPRTTIADAKPDASGEKAEDKARPKVDSEADLKQLVGAEPNQTAVTLTNKRRFNN